MIIATTYSNRVISGVKGLLRLGFNLFWVNKLNTDKEIYNSVEDSLPPLFPPTHIYDFAENNIQYSREINIY